MMLHDVGKLAVLLVVVIGLFALIAVGKAELEQIDWILAAVVGYVVGNGATAITRRAPSPMIVSKPRGDEVVTVDGPKLLVSPHDFPGNDAATALDDLKREGGNQWPQN